MDKIKNKAAVFCTFLLVTLQVGATPQHDEPTTNVEAIYIPTYNPNTGEIEFERCADYPHCYDLMTPEEITPNDNKN